MPDLVPIHGNYRGYYTKRPSFRDPRLDLVPKDVFRNARVLDVGCNEGWVTCEIAQRLKAKEVVGVDIDDVLIRAAWKRRRTVWSQHPRLLDHSQHSDSSAAVPPSKKAKLQHTQGSIEKEELIEEVEQREYSFPLAFQHMFGPLPIPPIESAEERAQFPHNVVFRTADWPKDGAVDDKDGYDVLLALSISKWIHLNDGDEGLIRFFRRVFSVLRTGGVFIFEPQEWETYHKAKRMNPTLRKNGETLKLRPSDFERELKNIGFSSVEHLGHTGKGGFQRALDLYRK